MGLLTVEGIYKDGKVELTERLTSACPRRGAFSSHCNVEHENRTVSHAI